MATIHHATRARAERLGVGFIDAADGGFHLIRLDNSQLSVDTFDSAKEALDSFEAGTVEFAKRSHNHCGVMVASYHARYESNPHGPGCGDDLDIALRNACTVQGEDLDLKKLKQIGLDAGVWGEHWEVRNPGMQRMNLANRLRALLRNDANATIQIGGERGRFGVAYKPAGRKAKYDAKTRNEGLVVA